MLCDGRVIMEKWVTSCALECLDWFSVSGQFPFVYTFLCLQVGIGNVIFFFFHYYTAVPSSHACLCILRRRILRGPVDTLRYFVSIFFQTARAKHITVDVFSFSSNSTSNPTFPVNWYLPVRTWTRAERNRKKMYYIHLYFDQDFLNE